ncbi:flagellar hook-length control protein FliK [Ferrimicrobium sp.]|uniref:flagellar hook-length control protein FliK n=1 Tax=Ferrimicrobium sp. TaxID=2926050 RepID=UPI00263366F5|nr:flagellar hook-length control protein FliK [Ferrimicrobium sp.]
MSPIASSTTTPLLEVLPRESPKASAASTPQATSKEHDEAGGAKTHLPPTFAEVQAGLDRPVVNRHRPTTLIPVVTTLTAPVPSAIAQAGHDTKESGQPMGGVAALATRSDATDLLPAPPTPPGAPMVQNLGNVAAQTRIVTPEDVGGQAQAAASTTKPVAVVSSASEAQAVAVVLPPQVPLGKDRQIGVAIPTSLPGRGGEEVGASLAPLSPATSVSRAPVMGDGLPRPVSRSSSAAAPLPASGRSNQGSQTLGIRWSLSAAPLPASGRSNQEVNAKAETNAYSGSQLVDGQSRVVHQPAQVGPLVEMNGASPLQRLDMAPPPSVPVAGATGEAVASSPLGQLGNIVAQVVREGNLPRTITIALEPKELGQLQLQVTSNGGEIQVHIQIADPLTRGIVSQQLSDLTNTLQRDLGFGGQQTGGQGEPSQSSSSDGVPMLGATPGAHIAAGAQTAVVTHSLVDVRL